MEQCEVLLPYSSKVPELGFQSVWIVSCSNAPCMIHAVWVYYCKSMYASKIGFNYCFAA